MQILMQLCLLLNVVDFAVIYGTPCPSDLIYSPYVREVRKLQFSLIIWDGGMVG